MSASADVASRKRVVSGTRLRDANGDNYAPGVFAGRFRLERPIAFGRVCDVLAGWHLSLDEPVAVKVLREEHWNRPQIEALFLHEARTGARLRGRHVARVLDFGRSELGGPFMVTEFLEGTSVRALLDSVGPLPLEYAVRLFVAIAEAVASIHAQGLVHRDLRPSNLFLADERGLGQCLKVLDLRLALPDGVIPERAVGAFGSPHYMAPEQMKGAAVDTRADVWSLGVVLYELLTGRLPFQGDTIAEACRSVEAHPPAPPSRFRPEIPRELDRLVLRCLMSPRQLRFASAHELSLAARRLLPDGESSTARLRPVRWARSTQSYLLSHIRRLGERLTHGRSVVTSLFLGR